MVQRLTSQGNIVVMHETVNGIEFSSDVIVLRALIEMFDGRMILVPTEYHLCLFLPVKLYERLEQRPDNELENFSLVWPVYVLNVHDGQVAVVTEVSEGDAGTWFDSKIVDGLLRHIKGYGHAEEIAIRQTFLVDNAKVELGESGRRGNTGLACQSKQILGSIAPIVVFLSHEP